jgi:hypothetical protein
MNAPLTKWYEESLALVPKMYRDEIKCYLDPIVKHCKAKTRSRYWMWLRQQLAKTEDSLEFAEWMRESSLPVERDTPFHYELDVTGDLALIDLGGNPARIWRLPAKDLVWAKSIFPFHVHIIPPLESPEFTELRSMRAKLRSRRLGDNERRTLEQRVKGLSAKISMGDVTKMPERYGLYKTIGGKEVSVARLYLRADIGEDVDALDGNMLNFGNVSSATIIRPLYRDGIALTPGIVDPENPERYISAEEVPNLYLTASSHNPRHMRTVPTEEFDKAIPQQKFEAGFLPVLYRDGGPLSPTAVDEHGELTPVETGERTPGNEDLGARVGVYGGVQDAGGFRPLSKKEAAELGLKGLETPIFDQNEPAEL